MATIRLRFHGSSLIAAYRVPVSGNPNLARNCQLRPLGFIKGDRDPISRPSLSSPLEVGARVCVNRVAARLARERAQARFPWSHCRRPAKEAASLIGIPISPSLSAFVCRGSRRTECSILRPGLWRCGQIGWTARKYFTRIFFFFFWRGGVKGGRWRTIFDDYDNLWNF